MRLLPSSTISLALLVGCAAPPLPDPLAAGWQGQSVCSVLEDTAEQRTLRCIFPPGVGHERHFHAPHSGTVVRGGTMRITDANGSRTVETASGTNWQSDGIEWHEVVNVGETTTEYLIVERQDAASR